MALLLRLFWAEVGHPVTADESPVTTSQLLSFQNHAIFAGAR